MKLKIAVSALVLAAATAPAFAQSSHLVQGYTRSNGTYVAPHYQTNADSTRMDNWTTRGNVNPYTGQEGTKNPYAQPSNPYAAQPAIKAKSPFDPYH